MPRSFIVMFSPTQKLGISRKARTKMQVTNRRQRGVPVHFRNLESGMMILRIVARHELHTPKKYFVLHVRCRSEVIGAWSSTMNIEFDVDVDT